MNNICKLKHSNVVFIDLQLLHNSWNLISYFFNHSAFILFSLITDCLSNIFLLLTVAVPDVDCPVCLSEISFSPHFLSAYFFWFAFNIGIIFLFAYWYLHSLLFS